MTIASFILSLFCIFEIICVPAIFLHSGLWSVIILYLLSLAVFIFVLWKMKKLPWKMRERRQRSGDTKGLEKSDAEGAERRERTVGANPKGAAGPGKKINALSAKLRILCILCILFQLVLVTFYRHTDDDDAWYLGLAVSAYETGEMFAYSPYTGEPMELSDGGDYVLSPLPVLWAALGKLFHIHPTILAHTVVPVFMLLWAYYVYWLLGKRLFGGEKESAGAYAFWLFMNVLNLFGFYSTRTSGTFLLFRSWQGKAVFCAVLAPCLFYYFLGLLQGVEKRKNVAGDGEPAKNEVIINEKPELLGIYLTMGTGCLASFSAVTLMPLLLVAMALTYAIAKHSIKIPLKMCGAVIPNVILVGIYVFFL